MKVRRFVAKTCLGITLAPTLLLHAQNNRVGSQTDLRSLEQFLRRYDAKAGGDKTTHYLYAPADLGEGARNSILVYLSGQAWCGSGGCTLIILERDAPSYRIIGQSTVTRLPIRILHSSTHGHRHLGVEVAGGGILHGYEAILPFNGKQYADNPTVAPARKVKGKVEGDVVIQETARPAPLYP